MTLKKLLHLASVLVMAMSLSCLFTACSDDEPEPPKEDRVPTSAMCTYQFECTQDMLDVLEEALKLNVFVCKRIENIESKLDAIGNEK